MTVQDKLIKRLRDMGIVIPEGTRLERTYAGRVQREVGAWSWAAIYRTEDTGTGIKPVGSQYSMTQLLAADKLTATETPWHDIEIDPA